ncbi:MAG: TIGR03067 domain-containing protein [Kofleriaceae bacterium]
MTGARRTTSDHDRLQGRWLQIASSIDGGVERDAPAGDEFGGGLVTELAGDTFRVVDATGTTVLAGRFVLDEATRAVDWIDAFGPDAGKPLPARYELTDTTFAFAAADAGEPRPLRVSAAPGVTLRRMVRAPAERHDPREG